MVDDEIEDDPDAVFLGVFLKAAEIRKCSVNRIDILIIGDIVAKIHLRGREAGSYPNRIHSQTLQVIHSGVDPVQVSDAIASAVGKTAGIDFVKHSMLPPLVTFRIDRLGLRVSKRRPEKNGQS